MWNNLISELPLGRLLHSGLIHFVGKNKLERVKIHDIHSVQCGVYISFTIIIIQFSIMQPGSIYTTSGPVHTITNGYVIMTISYFSIIVITHAHIHTCIHAGLVLMTILVIVMHSHSFLMGQKMSMISRIITTGAIYRKVSFG